mgnify:FL=1
MFYDNLKTICDKKNLKITPLVLECGGTKGVIGGWKKGAVPNSDIVMKLSVRLNVPTDVLLFGKEKSSLTNQLTADEQELFKIYRGLSIENKARVRERATVLSELETTVTKEPESEQETIFIEYSTLKVSAGTGEPLIDDTYHDFLKVKRSNLTEEANFAVQISGNSMLPRFKDKEWVLVRSQPDVEIGEIGIFIIDGNGYIKERAADRLVSINPEYDDIFFKENQDIKCKGLVIGTLESDDFV